MELILISNTKLKIMLDEDDMRKYSIGNDADCVEPSTRRAIRSLLDCARDQIGFNTEGEEIFVQLYTSKHGGCELFVTKTLKHEEKEEQEERVKSRMATERLLRDIRSPSHRSLPEPQTEHTYRKEQENEKTAKKQLCDRLSRIAFSFPTITELCKVCHILETSGIKPESRACTDDIGGFYLILFGAGMSAYSRLDRLTFINEYGRRENPDCLISHISEHGKIICEDHAIETLAPFA